MTRSETQQLKKDFQRILAWNAGGSGTQTRDHQSQLYMSVLCCRPSAAGEAFPAESERPYSEPHKKLAPNDINSLLQHACFQRHHSAAPPLPLFALIAKD